MWIHAHTKCFETESDVREFKDFLLTNYECIDFDEERRPIIYKQPGVGYNFWSLWLERDGDLECLSRNVTLPNRLVAECIPNVFYESLQYLDQQGICVDQPTGTAFWATDILDGSLNGIYAYRDFSTTQRDVLAIVLDTDVYHEHVEFTRSNSRNLFTGTPAPTTQQGHGTHVTGSIIGVTTGGVCGAIYISMLISLYKIYNISSTKYA